MPVMSDQVREARAERLLALRFEEEMSPSAAWRKVRPTSKAGDIQAAELTRRDIRWLQSRRETADDDAPAVTAATAAKVALTEGAAAALPKKRCVGVEDDNPCGRAISRRRTRCVACSTERRRILRKGYNLDCSRRRKERRIREAEERRALSTLAVVLRLVLVRCREVAAQREREAALRRVVEELAEAIRASRPASSRMIASGYGWSVLKLPDSRLRKYVDHQYPERSKILQPGEPVPVVRPSWAR